ncbi:Bax inhibitor-1/YccA family protein [Streptomyces sp. NPDC006654]|uniref:Bax inhibitor-1/YccA family membrane protein n=1 Tax=Streptomyces sp. NPDC006654 TaxID=3156897 RepID=UPI00340D2ABD
MAAVERRSLRSSNPILCWPQFARESGQKTAFRGPRTEISASLGRAGAGHVLNRDLMDEFSPMPFTVGDLMTLDDVLSRVAGALALTSLTAVSVWTLLSHAVFGAAVSYSVTAATGLSAAGLVFHQCRVRRSSALWALTFAIVQGIFLAVISVTVSAHVLPGAFVQMVLATLTTLAGVLLAYKLHWMRVHRRIRGFVGAALIGLGFLGMTDWVLYSVLGADGLGLQTFGPAITMASIGTVLGVVFLSLHLRQVENAIRFGVPGDQCWAAAFGLVVTLSWLYVETVRLPCRLLRGLLAWPWSGDRSCTRRGDPHDALVSALTMTEAGCVLIVYNAWTPSGSDTVGTGDRARTIGSLPPGSRTAPPNPSASSSRSAKPSTSPSAKAKASVGATTTGKPATGSGTSGHAQQQSTTAPTGKRLITVVNKPRKTAWPSSPTPPCTRPAACRPPAEACRSMSWCAGR